ncbi:MAG TPA: pyruvate, phosphate dikinase, partial [bacterium]|nr:pyruvate, phosphate dikinase [bacterium]
GGKGANLAEMTNIGIPVPPGFTITTEVCRDYHNAGNRFPDGLLDELSEHVSKLETIMNSRFGDADRPLLVSVRSGAARSMPGMMDTVLNLGINPDVVDGLIRKTGDRRFALDVYRRFIQMFGDVVMGVPHDACEETLQSAKHAKGVSLDTELDADDLQKVIDTYIKLYEKHTGEMFPVDPAIQLQKSIEAVFRSWNNPRAIKYRQLNDIKGLIGTAVNVQTMVFGNLGDTSGTGVAFTRDPATGTNDFYGEYLMNAQGEDVVAGIRTPKPIETLEAQNPVIYSELMDIRQKLEAHYKDMQDLEFTIQEGKLYILQTRTGKRTIFSWIRTQVEMVEEGLIDSRTAVERVPAGELGKLFAPILDPDDIKKRQLEPVTQGLNASPGGACGKVVFTAEDAEEWAARGEKVILVRIETSPEDIGGMHASQGILTSRGGMTSHAAVVARGMGCPCVSGAGELKINYAARRFECNGRVVNQGDLIAIDGFTGHVYVGDVTVKPSEIVQVLRGQMKPEESKLYHDYAAFMGFVDAIRTMKVRTNADTPADTAIAVKFGAEGIGLCRTEHMFFEGDRIISFRRLILVAEKVKQLRTRIETASGDARNALEKELEAPLAQYHRALDELLPLQREDFDGIFRALNGLPATIRALDPPLHEFLPHDRDGQKEMADTMGVDVDQIKATIASLNEFNPMLGHRGCRLGISYPEVTAMQVRAIIEAALDVHEDGIPVKPEIMIPLVGTRKELQMQRDVAEDTIRTICRERGIDQLPFEVLIGTMIEVPRAALTAEQVAESADFFSFGTNDLTQMTCGFSRDDAGKFLGEYVARGIYEYDPFQVLDQTGVGLLVEMAAKKGRSVKSDLKLGICGEHGGEPKSVEFCQSVGLDYVSCSPYRVPIARLAAAQSVLKMK